VTEPSLLILNFFHFGKISHQKNTASGGRVIDGVILRKLLIG